MVSNDNGGGIFELLEQGDPRFSDVSVAGLRHPARRRRRRVVPRLPRRLPAGRGRRTRRGARRAGRRDAGAGGQGRPVVAAGAARVDQGGAVSDGRRQRCCAERPGAQILIPHLYGDPTKRAAAHHALGADRRRHRGVPGDAAVGAAGGRRVAQRLARSKRNMGVAAAEVLDAGPRRSTIEFVTPDRVTYRPELGVLYPSELAHGHADLRRVRQGQPRSGSRAAPQRLAGDHPGRVDRGGRLAGRRRRRWPVWR